MAPKLTKRDAENPHRAEQNDRPEPKLTKAQREALGAFDQCEGGTLSTYQRAVLKVSAVAIADLEHLKLIQWVRNHCHWIRTDAGRAALKDDDPGSDEDERCDERHREVMSHEGRK